MVSLSFSRAYWVAFCEICFNHHGSLEVLRVGPSMLGTAAWLSFGEWAGWQEVGCSLCGCVQWQWYHPRPMQAIDHWPCFGSVVGQDGGIWPGHAGVWALQWGSSIIGVFVYCWRSPQEPGAIPCGIFQGRSWLYIIMYIYFYGHFQIGDLTVGWIIIMAHSPKQTWLSYVVTIIKSGFLRWCSRSIKLPIKMPCPGWPTWSNKRRKSPKRSRRTRLQPRGKPPQGHTGLWPHRNGLGILSGIGWSVWTLLQSVFLTLRVETRTPTVIWVFSILPHICFPLFPRTFTMFPTSFM